ALREWCVGLRSYLAGVDEKLVIAFAIAVAVIRALNDDIDLFPGVHAKVIHEQSFSLRVPRHAMRMAEAVGIDFRTGGGYVHERIRIGAGRRNAIASIRRELILGAQIQVRSNAQQLADERIQTLRQHVSGSRGLALRAVADRNVE